MENQIAELKKELAALQVQLKTHQIALEMLAVTLEPNARQQWADYLASYLAVRARTTAEIAQAEPPLLQSIQSLQEKVAAPLSLS